MATGPDVNAAEGGRGWLGAAALLYAAAFVGMTLPVWVDPGARVIGHPDSDIWKHLWGDAWFLRELGAAWPVPLQTRLLAYPDGGLLYNLDPLTGVVVALLGPLVGVVVAHNLAMMGAFVAGGVGMFSLARRLVGDPAAAVVAGALYVFNAQLLSLALVSGIGETAHVAWLPLSCLAALLLCEGRGLRPALWGGACLALAALGSWYYGLISGVLVVLVWVWHGVAEGWERARWVRAAGRIAVMGGVGLVFVAPFAAAFLRSLDPTSALNSAASAGLGSRDLLPSFNGAVVTVRDLVVPGQPRLNLVRDLLVFSNHPGLLGWALVAVALLANSSLTWPLLGAGGVMLLVGFGPYIHADRATPVLPNLLFLGLERLPLFGMIRNLERFQVPFTLCFALAGAVGARHLFDLVGFGRWGRRLAAPALVGVCVLDASLVSGLELPLTSAETAVPAIYGRLAQSTEPYGIIELPITDRPGGRPFWYQTRHLKPLPLNLEGVVARSLWENPLLRVLVGQEILNQYPTGKTTGTPDLAALTLGRDALLARGFRYVILTRRPDRRDEEEELRVREILWAVLGPPLTADLEDANEVYVLDPIDRRAP